MSSKYLTTASSIVLALVLVAPAVGAEQQVGEEQAPQLEIEKTGKEASLGAGVESSPDAGKSETGTKQARGAGETGKTDSTTGKHAEEIPGTKVVNNSGEEIGEVEAIVREKGTDELHAVVSVGGFLGIGDEEVIMSLLDLEMAGTRLLAPFAISAEELKTWPLYKERLYKEVPGKQIVAVVSSGGEISETDVN